MASIRVGPDEFNIASEMANLHDKVGEAGAVACFLGLVRGGYDAPITAMTLEHYRGMTERSMMEIATEAEERFQLSSCRIVHRTGRVPIGGQIVIVLATAQHRAAALEAVAFLVDWLKVKAPFWKKEHFEDGTEKWVDARAADDEAALRWKLC